jgi:long-chain fatty acid transport protein
MKKLFVISLLFVGIGFGQTVNDAVRLALPGFGSGARAMGMGNAFVAMSDDGLGMNYNPAGIALVRRFELGGGFKYSNVQNNSTFFGNQLQAGNTSANLDNFSLLFPIPTLRGSLVIGTSYNAQHDFTGKMDFNGYNQGKYLNDSGPERLFRNSF